MSTINEFENIFETYIKNQKCVGMWSGTLENENDENEDDEIDENIHFGLEMENEYKFVLNTDFDPQIAYILDKENKVIASSDCWNK